MMNFSYILVLYVNSHMSYFDIQSNFSDHFEKWNCNALLIMY